MGAVCFVSSSLRHAETVNKISRRSVCLLKLSVSIYSDTDAFMLLSGGLRGDGAEWKLCAFAKQELSGVMATSEDYPTLHRSERREG